MTRPRDLYALALEHRLPLVSGLCALGSIVVVSSAWSFQLIGGYMPCELCLEQRIPYYAGAPLALLALLVSWKAPDKTPLVRLLLIAFALLMIYGGGVGAYQAGAEWGFWPGPLDCSGDGGGGVNDAASLLNSLQTIKIVSCTDVQLRILGLSFAGWNVLTSAGLAAIAFWAALARGRRA
ncbi:disulfide bond formation protein B [Breoghania sp.]|uniref:disulfide bond formation protein B n=1 Tax=Breoghania sp. TaxID=2065378 RepID=UPI002AAB816A|nr:disulfide bond formation protein B [Breoghania sp.]